jgi:hypothetical protein
MVMSRCVKGAGLLSRLVLLIGSSDNESLLWAREFGLEFGLGLAGKILLSSTKLEQSRSQPQNKSGPSTGSFSLGGFGSVS